jgi:hypothetical protein
VTDAVPVLPLPPLVLRPYYEQEFAAFHEWFFSYGLFDAKQQQKIKAKDYPYLAAAG